MKRNFTLLFEFHRFRQFVRPYEISVKEKDNMRKLIQTKMLITF